MNGRRNKDRRETLSEDWHCRRNGGYKSGTCSFITLGNLIDVYATEISCSTFRSRERASKLLRGTLVFPLLHGRYSSARSRAAWLSHISNAESNNATHQSILTSVMKHWAARRKGEKWKRREDEKTIWKRKNEWVISLIPQLSVLSFFSLPNRYKRAEDAEIWFMNFQISRTFGVN